MAKKENQKSKLLYLAKILKEETDEEHGLSMPQIIAKLGEYGIPADRKTVYLDLDELRSFGLDIVSEKSGRQTLYKLISREFELAELKLLVDSVLSAKFITENKSRQLIKKLEALVSVHDAKQLHRQVIISGRVKTMNESIYYNVDKLHTAINSGRQIRFRYFRYNVDKQEEYRRDGNWYIVSPWALRWDDENYYLIAYEKASDMLRHYRVDKMKSITVTEKPREGKELMESFDEAAYSRKLFGMYGGNDRRVTLLGSNDIVGVLFDRFGRDIPIIKTDSGHFSTTVDVTLSPQFYGWVAGLSDSLIITAPEEAVSAMKKLSERLSGQYKE